jgi:hypothetical protein
LADDNSSRILSASRSGSPVRRAAPAMGQVSTSAIFTLFHANKHLGRCADQLLIAKLE